MSDVFNTSVTGLNVSKSALNTIAQNVANANTPGYARQVVQATAQAPSRSGGGYVGNGVEISGISALVSPYLEAQLTAAAAHAANTDQLATYFDGLQSVLGDKSSGISTAQTNWQGALGQVALNPSSIPARQLVLSTAKALVNSLNTVGSQLQTQKQQAGQTLGTDVSQVNSYLLQIAKLNDVITKSEPRDSNGIILEGQQANDLRSQRQTIINKLATLTNVNTVEQNEGVSISIGGSAVVISNRASSLSTQQDPLDPTKLTVGIKTSAGQLNLDAATVGGKIGATLDFVDNGINKGLAQVSQYAGVLAQAVNDQSAKGVDLYGSPGGQVFTVDAPTAQASSANAGTLSLTATVNAYQSQPSDYKLNYSSTTGYALTRLSDNTVVANGLSLPLVADGLSIATGGGAPSDGDSFLIHPFGNQAANVKLNLLDPKLLALSNPVATSAAVSNTSSATISAPTVVSSLPLNANLTSPVSITFTSPNQYTISGPGIGSLTSQPYVSGQAISYNGWSLSVSGVPKTGDVFNIKKSSGASGDGTNANAIGELLQGKNFGSNSESLADLYGNIQSTIGNQANLAQTNATSDASVLNIAQNQRESYSGVNLDQEAADLARWQQIYAANAQVMSIAQKLFETLINQL